MNRMKLVALAVLVGVLGTGCAGAEDSAPRAAQASATPDVQLTLQPATGQPLVELTGLVNGGKPISADLASLDALPEQTVTTYEPFVKQVITFTGVSFADLLSAAKARGESVTVHALDDYEKTLDAAVLREPGVLLATRVGGELIDVADGGPVRLVFPKDSEAGKDSDLWVWSVDRITVE